MLGAACGVTFESGGAVAAVGGAGGSPTPTGGAAPGGDGSGALQQGAGGAISSSGGAGDGGGGQGGSPVSATMAALDSLRVEVPCGNHSGAGCDAGANNNAVSVDGDGGTVYAVTLRVRGVVEQNSYQNGSQTGFFYEGGAPDNGGWNEVRLDVSAPMAHYFLNAGVSGVLNCFLIDYQITIPIAGAATVGLTNDAKDGTQVINQDEIGQPISVPNIMGLAQPYDGQWVQLDVIAVGPP
jgi:hypothetical protein